MTTVPKLTTQKDFVIEQVTRKPIPSGDFTVTIKLTEDDRRTLVVSYETLLDFEKFRAAALFVNNVLLRHQAEERNPLGRISWLELLSEAIKRGMAKQQQTHAG